MEKIHKILFYLLGIFVILGIILFLSKPVHAIFELPHYAIDDENFITELNDTFPECSNTWCLRLNITQITSGALKNNGDTATGNYSFNVVLTIDDTNNRVGINTANPTTVLDVNGSANINGEIHSAGTSNDGTGRLVCIKSNGDYGTTTIVLGILQSCT